MRTDGNLGWNFYLLPQQPGWIDQPQLNEPLLALEGAAAHWDHRVNDDHYQQPGANLFARRLLTQQVS